MALPMRVERRTWLVIVSAAFAIVSVAIFDVRSNLPFLDEYARRWTVQQLVAGHGLRFWGRSSDLVQILIAAAPAALRTAPGTWRLTELPFYAAQGVFICLAARRLGASQFWSIVAGAAMVCNPINLYLATGMMTETVFLGLFLGSAWYSMRWLTDGRSIAPAVVLGVLATLQRQQGAALPLAMSMMVLLERNRRRPTRRDFAGLGLFWAGCLGALVAAEVLARSTVQTSRATGAVAHHLFGFAFWVYGVASLMPLLGFLLLPLAGGLLLSDRHHDHWFPGWAAVLLADLGILFAWLVSRPQRGSIFPGNILNDAGLGPPFLEGKPALLSGSIFLLIEVLSTLSFVLALVWRQDWHWRAMGSERKLLILNAALQFIFIFYQGQVFDRYYMVMTACLLPVVAASLPSRAPRAAAAWAGGAILAGVFFYIAGEQDYQAWQGARDVAARNSYTTVVPWQVAAGWEAEAEYVWIPARDDYSLPPVVDARPRYKLIFVPLNDPRGGVPYFSLASGRLLLVPVGKEPVQH